MKTVAAVPNPGLTAPQESVVTKVGIDATAKPFRKDMPPVVKLISRINLKDSIVNLENII